MRTSVRKYNEQYKEKRLYVDGYHNAEIVPTCNEHKRCEVCPVHSHVELCAWHFLPEGVQEIYICPTCGKSYGVIKTCEGVFETFAELGI